MLDQDTRPSLAESRIVRRSDLVPCKVAFIDCKLPGSELKENYSIIGAGVTQSEDQVVNLAEPHGFAIGVAAMPNGVTNNLHIHYTAEVFMIFRGEWLFRWGVDGKEGELVGREGDVISIPTWIFRGFTNIGPDDGWIFTALGRDDSGGVIWHPEILRGAAEHGLYLRKNNMMVDVVGGATKPSDEDLMEPLSEDFIAGLRRYTVEDMKARLTLADERDWSSRALLDSVIPGHRSEIAPAIGFGMTQDRDASPKVTNPHGFSIEWMRIDPGEQVGPFRLLPKQVLIVQKGAIEITLGRGADASTVTVSPWDVFAFPQDMWRTIRSVGTEPAVFTVTTSGDARALVEWDPELVEAARDCGVGVDPNGYLAVAGIFPSSKLPDGVRPNTLRARKTAGQPIVNAWLSIGAPYAAEIVAHGGYDAVTVDCQHGMMGFDVALAMLQAISTTPAIPLVRPARNDPGEIMRWLDAGAYGLICPMISTRAEAEAFVSACRYAPIGTRSFGPSRGLLYGGDDYAAHANKEILTLAMIETAQGLQNLDEIVATPGLDGIYIGPNDLALALGCSPAAESDDATMVAAIEKIRKAVVDAGRIAGIFCSGGAGAARRLREGFDLVTPGNDAMMLKAAVASAVRGTLADR